MCYYLLNYNKMTTFDELNKCYKTNLRNLRKLRKDFEQYFRNGGKILLMKARRLIYADLLRVIATLQL